MVRNKQVSTYLTPDEVGKLTAQARQENRTLSDFLRLVILKATGNEPKPDKPDKPASKSKSSDKPG